MNWSINRLAGRAVALHLQGDVTEKRELLEMLGIVDPGGSVVLPDDRRSYHLEPINDAYVEADPEVVVRESRRGFTTPPGLANLPPTPKKTAEPRPEPAHGSWAGRRFHQKLGEPQCRECADFLNAWRRSNNRKRAEQAGRVFAEPPKARDLSEGSVCGTERGWSRHRRRGEDCDACHEAYRRTARERGRRTRRKEKWSAEQLAGDPQQPVVHVPGQLNLDGEEESA